MAAAGLPQAVIVLEATARARPRKEAELEKILADPLEANRRARLAQAYRQSRITIEDGKNTDIEPDTLEFVTGGRCPLSGVTRKKYARAEFF